MMSTRTDKASMRVASMRVVSTVRTPARETAPLQPPARTAACWACRMCFQQRRSPPLAAGPDGNQCRVRVAPRCCTRAVRAAPFSFPSHVLRDQESRELQVAQEVQERATLPMTTTATDSAMVTPAPTSIQHPNLQRVLAGTWAGPRVRPTSCPASSVPVSACSSSAKVEAAADWSGRACPVASPRLPARALWRRCVTEAVSTTGRTGSHVDFDLDQWHVAAAATSTGSSATVSHHSSGLAGSATPAATLDSGPAVLTELQCTSIARLEAAQGPVGTGRPAEARIAAAAPACLPATA
mmetsp:Transcript_60914/g.127692  ORF Transcript_60914/g.127692 Transcript_60914/m.127692 type:complete len:297 (-) Transcript_60914:48-938(-)